MASLPGLSGQPDSQSAAPLYEALRAWVAQGITSLFTPAHRGAYCPDGLRDLLTPLGLACDLPCMDGTDYIMHPGRCLADAQRLAANLFRAEETFFLAHGASSGVEAMVLAALVPGDSILLSRHFHLSTFSALVLSGAVPIYLPSRWTEDAGPIPTSAAEVEASLDLHPDVRAVFVTHPTYYGLGRSLSLVAAACRRRGVPLLVDEAHGGHLHFLPPGHLRSGLADGADLVVQSPHKTLGSMVGTAQLHRGRNSLVAGESVRSALNLLHSTSPSFILLASLDLVRRDLARDGFERFSRGARAAADLRSALAGIPGLKVLQPRQKSLAGCAVDPMRLVVDVSSLGLTGQLMESRLLDEFNLLCEFSDARNVAFVLSPADGPEVHTLLIEALRHIAGSGPLPRRPTRSRIRVRGAPAMVLKPREAAFAPKRSVPLATAAGAVSGEIITLYPPGIPLICPGELFTASLLRSLAELARGNAPLMCSDPSLETVRIIEE